jgi:hypothetical protein
MAGYNGVERRRSPRIYGPFPALVVGKSRLHTTLEDLSAGGFYLRLAERPDSGARLLIVTQISQALVLARGLVVRSGPQADGTYGVAAQITQYRIFSMIKVAPSKFPPLVAAFLTTGT